MAWIGDAPIDEVIDPVMELLAQISELKQQNKRVREDRDYYRLETHRLRRSS